MRILKVTCDLCGGEIAVATGAITGFKVTIEGNGCTVVRDVCQACDEYYFNFPPIKKEVKP